MESIRRHYDDKHPVLSLPAVTAILLFASLGTTGNYATANEAEELDHAVGSHVEPGAKKTEELDPSHFDRSENIDNAWWPLKAGMQWTYVGHTVEDGVKIPHRLVTTVTDLVKVINGVRTRVIFETDYSDGELVEDELAYFAQDKAGNVWHLGEYVEVFEDGELVGGKIWHVGNPKEAKAGIMMPTNPRPNTPSYSEGYAPPPFHWTDRGRVHQTGQKIQVAAGSYDDVLVIEEFDAEQPGAFQLKYYARGVGNVRVDWRGKGKWDTERLELVKAIQLGEEELARVRATAYELEKRAGMFPRHPPMEHVPLVRRF